jgi:cysteine-rich repeat protein
VVEGKEECDDGDLQDGDGCSSMCKIEAGWSCTGHPSKCTKGGKGPTPPPAPAPAPAPGSGGHGGDVAPPASGGGGSSGGNKGSSRRHGSIAAAVLVPVFFLVVAGGLFAYRGAVYEQFPQVEAAVTNLQAAMGGVFKKADGRYAALALDPEELDISPEFLSPTPARPPGSSGPYSPLP